jgi:hypothetical protein
MNRGKCIARATAIRPEVDDDVVPDAVDEDAESDLEEETQRGMRTTQKMADPKLPSQEEVEEHQKTHLPFRNWCRHCIRGKGKEAPHFKGSQTPNIPEFHLDFMFMGEEDVGNNLTMLVAKERLTKAVMGTVLPSKTRGEFAARRVVAFMREMGCEHCVINVKSDNEPAVMALMQEVGRWRAAAGGQQMNVETSPAYASQSNGYIESGVKTLQGHIRVLKSALEANLGVAVPQDHAVLPWLVEYAGWLINRAEVGHDGKTPYERSKGKMAKLTGMEFGEAVLWKRRPIAGALGKLSCLWGDGIFLGIKGSSGEIMVGDTRGVWKTRTARRKPKEERWGSENLKLVGGVPWRINDEDPKMDGEPRNMDMGKSMLPEEARALEEEGELRDTEPRRFRIDKSDLEAHGYTQGCPGCKAILTKSSRQGHNESCRKKFEEAMADTEKVEKSRKKAGEFVEKCIEKEEAKKRKVEEAAKELLEDTRKKAEKRGSEVREIEEPKKVRLAEPEENSA